MKIAKKVKSLIDYYSVNFKIEEMPDGWGASSNHIANSIQINSKIKNKGQFYSLILHELGHIHCYKKGIWKNYHLNTMDIRCMNNKQKSIKVKIGFKVEKWIDNWAKKKFEELKLCKKYKFIGFYIDNEKYAKKWYNEAYLNKFRNRL